MAAPLRSAITGVAQYHPERVVTNRDLEKLVDTSDEWIQTRTGIVKRHFVKEGQTSSDMAAKAAETLLKKTKTDPKEIDLILCATITPDMMFPATACLIQDRIGATNAWGFDIQAACSGFIYALSVANQFVRGGKHKKVLAIGVDTMSSILNMQDRNTCVLFGDGAGAALLEPVPETTGLGILDTVCHIDGSGGELLCQPAGGCKQPPSHETVDQKLHYVRQEGKQVFKFAVSEMARVSEEVLHRNDFTGKDLDLFVPHQANLRIIESTQKKLGLPDNKVVINIDKFGNTTAATLPTCLVQAADQGQLKKGDLVLLTSFGAGFTWGSVLLRWAY